MFWWFSQRCCSSVWTRKVSYHCTFILSHRVHRPGFWQIYQPRPIPLLQSLEQAVGGIGLHINADKTERICFIEIGHISTLNGDSLKRVDKFTYLGSSISSTENDINTRLAKAWGATDRLSVIWKSDISDKIKCFSKKRPCQYNYMDLPLTKRMGKSLTAITWEYCIGQVLEITSCTAENLRPSTI